MSNSDESFLREVQEEVRRERMAKLFERYGVPILVVAGLIIAGIAGWQWYSAYERDVAEKAGGRFAAAQRMLRSEKAEDKEVGLKDFQEIASTGPANYKTLALLQIAARQLDAGKSDEAKETFTKAAAVADADPELKSYARLQLASLEADTADFDALSARLKPLMVETSTWRFSARELLAVKAVKSGKADDARQLLGQLLGDTAAPASIRQRAEMLLSIINAPPPPKTDQGASQKPAPTPAKEAPAKPTTSGDAAPASGGSATSGSATQANSGGDKSQATKKPETNDTESTTQ